MIKRASEHKHDVSSALFGGSGDVIFDRIIETPAELMGLNKGKIKEGYDAHILLTDSSLNIKNVIIGGKLYM